MTQSRDSLLAKIHEAQAELASALARCHEHKLNEVRLGLMESILKGTMYDLRYVSHLALGENQDEEQP